MELRQENVGFVETGILLNQFPFFLGGGPTFLMCPRNILDLLVILVFRFRFSYLQIKQGKSAVPSFSNVLEK